MRDYFSPKSITFTEEQVRWLLPFMTLLRVGIWPPNFKESGYLDTKIIAKNNKPSTPFVPAADVAAEIDIRLERAGIRGLMLEYYWSQDVDDRQFAVLHLARIFRTDSNTIEQRLEETLKFISGEKRQSPP